MTKSKLNPFPHYTVARLADDSKAIADATVPTGPILEARRRVEAYAAGFGADHEGPPPSSVNAVRGDPGTGKTHLLVDAWELLRSRHPDSTVLRLTCIEADPVDWFRIKVGPQLDPAILQDLVIRLLARCGEKVAARAPLTKAAVNQLKSSPVEILSLIRKDHLNATAVQREFDAAIKEACPPATENVLRALSGLAWSETESTARDWLAGLPLDPAQRERLRLSEKITDADEASAVIGAAAALHAAMRRPFTVLIDELEQFTIYDGAQKARANITWLKRLLEVLGSTSALVFVAGQWAAWHTTQDYLDRFPEHAPIDMLKISADDVLVAVSARVGTGALGAEAAREIVEVTRGNIRRVMSLCGTLFRRTDGFAKPVTVEDVRTAWDDLAQRIPAAKVLEEIRQALDDRALTVEMNSSVAGITFDLVARRRGVAVILVRVTRGVDPAQIHNEARRFPEQVAEIGKEAGGVVGYFLADGNVDDELLSILQAAPRSQMRWFDLTESGSLTRILESLEEFAGSAPAAGRPGQKADAGRTSAEPSASDEELRRRLDELEHRRAAELSDLRARLDELTANAKTPRTAEVIGRDVPSELVRSTYEEVLREPSILDKLRGLDTTIVSSLTFVAFGLAMVFKADWVAQAFSSGQGTLRPFVLLSISSGVGLIGSAVVLILRSLSRVQDYADFSRRLLRDLYLRNATAADLVSADRVLRGGLRRATSRNVGESTMAQLARLPWQSRDVETYLGTLSGFH